MKLAVIGTGNMGKALLGGFVRGGVIRPEEAWCFDVFTEACTGCAEELGVNAIQFTPVFDHDNALKSIRDDLKPEAIVLSIAAAVTCARIGGILGEGRKFVRIMPNTPAQVGLGVSAVCPVGLSDGESEFVLELLNTCGETILCDENTLDAIGCVSGTGPAYVMLFIEAMADAAVSLGIKRADALKIAAATVAGSGKLALETGKHPAVLKDMVCSPAGTTIRGVGALEEAGFRYPCIKSIDAIMDMKKSVAK